MSATYQILPVIGDSCESPHSPACCNGAEIGIQVWPEPRSVRASLYGLPGIDNYWRGETGVNHIKLRFSVSKESNVHSVEFPWSSFLLTPMQRFSRYGPQTTQVPWGLSSFYNKVSFGISTVLTFWTSIIKVKLRYNKSGQMAMNCTSTPCIFYNHILAVKGVKTILLLCPWRHSKTN